MKRHIQKPHVILLLSLCFAGLILFCVFSFLSPAAQKPKNNIHVSRPSGLEFFENAFRFDKKEFDASQKKVVAGIIPHHLLAADLLADFFYHLNDKEYGTVIVIGPNHFNRGNFDIITSGYDWQTPYGILENDQDVFHRAMQWERVGVDEEAIAGEHSITSEVSFIRKIFPKAKFLPLMIKPSIDQNQAAALAGELFELSKSEHILVLASVDFSHYKDSATAQKNDQQSIGAIRGFDFDSIYQLDIDSPASIYTVLKFSKLSGAGFELLRNTNSALLADKPDLESTTSYVTGYFTVPRADDLPDPTKMLFFGDMMLDRGVGEILSRKGLDHIFGNLDEADFFGGYDMVSANLEGAVTNNGEHYAPDKEFDFAFSPNALTGVKDYGFTFFSLANNHFGDQGAQGMRETRANLDALGFGYAGCENGVLGDCSSAIIESKNVRIGMAAFSAVGIKIDLAKVGDSIAELKKKTDAVVVNVHWGEEYAAQFGASQQELAHALVDAGADAVIGHHPHVAQGIEVYHNRPIFYSLGNFVFDQYFSDETQKGLAVEMAFTEDALDIVLHPLESSNSRVSEMAGEEKDSFLLNIAARSALDEAFAVQVASGVLHFAASSLR